MNINGANSLPKAMDDLNAGNGGVKEPPSASSVQSFNQAMDSGKTGQASSTSCDHSSGKDGSDAQLQELKDLITQLIQMLTQMLQGGQAGSSQQDTGKSRGGSTPNGENGGISPVEGSGPGGSAGSNELIPPPQENIQTLNLGGKQVTVGGDGTGSTSASEVKATADNIQNLYSNSPSFRNMIDSSSDPSFTVSVGRRADNTSWGNTTGKLFMNLNNVSPNNSDTFQSLLAHEFAHASVDLGHGSQMEQVENAVAQEA